MRRVGTRNDNYSSSNILNIYIKTETEEKIMGKVGKCCSENKLGVILTIIGAVVVIAGIAAVVYKVFQNRKLQEDAWDLEDDDDCCFYADDDMDDDEE